MTKRLLLAAALISSMACESVDSEDIGTGGIFANLSVIAEGGGATTATARLKVGGATSNTYLELGEADRLEATAEGSTTAMAQRNDPFGQVWYEAQLTGDAEDTVVTIAFIRDNDPNSSDSATGSTATLPAPFELTSPTSDQSFSRSADDVTFTWDVFGEGDTLTATIDGDCVAWTISEETIQDTGTFTVAAGLLVPDDDAGESCVATVTLTRTREGGVDSRYGEGGVFFASQRRIANFTSTP